MESVGTDENTEGLATSAKIVKTARRQKQIRSKTAIQISRVKRHLFKHVWLVRGILLSVILVVIFVSGLLMVSLVNSLGIGRYLRLANNFLFTPSDRIVSTDGRTNILILGKGGAGHEAPDLTDTMIFASVSHENRSLTMVSLPRDIWISSLRAKLNSAYYWGNQKKERGGLVLAKSTVEEIVGKPIHYGVVIDLSALEEVVDTLGGVEVDVANAFTDEKFPVPGREADLCEGDLTRACRFQTIKFEKGLQTMDGDTVLKFVRSRNAEGDEGTDFARSARQQRVIEAIGRKILTKEILLSTKKIRDLTNVFNKSVESDIDEDAGVILARRYLDSRDSRKSVVLGEDLLENPPINPKYDNLYVFIPKKGDWSEVHKWIEETLP